MDRSVQPMLALDANGNPVDGLTPQVLAYLDVGKINRSAPAITGLGGGLYTFTPTLGDLFARTVYLIDLDPGALMGVRDDLRYWVGSVAPRYAPAEAVLFRDPAGGFWSGSAPSIGKYVNGAGAPVTPQAELRELVSPYLFVVLPSNADRLNGVSYRIDAPAGAEPAFWEGSFGPQAGATGGDPATDLAQFLEDSGPFSGVDLVLTQNLFTGPELDTRPEVPDLAVFVELHPGLRPDPYLGRTKSFYRFQLMVTVRSNPAEWDVGDRLSRALLFAIQAQKPSGYIDLLAQQSGPEHYQEDGDRRHKFRFFVELWWKG
jgi:hypothetical protein